MSPLFLSRAHFDLRVSRGFTAGYTLHQLVADLFGDREDRGYLFRTMTESPRDARVLILSDDPPNDDIPERDWGDIRRVETKEYDVPFREDQLLDYEVRINATRVVTQPSGRKKRVDVWDAVFAEDRETELTPHDVYAEYLGRRLKDAAELEHCRVVGRGDKRLGRPGRQAIRFVATDLIGTLRVLDPAAFRRTMFQGVGRSKAFGCGLLCLSLPGSILPRRYGVTERI